MQNIQKYNIIAILTLSIVAGIFNSISSFAQEGNQTQTATEEEEHSTEAGHSAEEEKEYNNTNTVRDSVTVLLQEKVIPAGDFIHLYDSTPYHIMDGHIALKVPCEDDSTSPIQVLVGSAPNMTAATLENVPPLSTPGEQCLYHMDLMPSGNIITLTDIALKNTSEENIEFPPTSTVVIGINEVKKGEHGHSESTEEHAATSTAEAGHTE
ncbi:MAG: uncharacterized protein K0S93_1577 [Nitrososphaeraceae archaeon]|nr:uncharacterized protein [Nitrososphaeraceae archaeon]